MSAFRIEKIDYHVEKDYINWKKLLEVADGVTLFHNPDFLKYHGKKFNEHHLGIFKGEALIGIMPMALINDGDKTIAKSPYGASFGGPIFNQLLNYSDSHEVVLALKNHLETTKVDQISLTPPLPLYYNLSCDTFLFCLLEQKFNIINADISSIVSLSSPQIENTTFTSRGRNMARKASKEGVTCVFNARIEDFWLVIDATFKKHNTKPTHTFEEWKWLTEHLPNDVWCDVAYYENSPVAGIGHFKINSKVDSSFYLCTDPAHQSTQALSLLLYESIIKSQNAGFKWFDFGTSSINMVARENIFRFKESYGAIGCLRKTLLLEL
jgi:hypothetical protein